MPDITTYIKKFKGDEKKAREEYNSYMRAYNKEYRLKNPEKKKLWDEKWNALRRQRRAVDNRG